MSEIKHGSRTIIFDEHATLLDGDLCKLHPCMIRSENPEPHEKPTTWFDRLGGDEDFDGTREVAGVLKVARSIEDEDLVQREASTLAHLFPLTAKDEKFYRYLPRWLDYPVPFHGYEALLMVWLTDYVSLADVARAYPAGIDYRDWAWMFKRALEGLGFVHKRGVIHGAVLPQNIMIHPTGHGAKLIDWCYSVLLGERRSIPAYVFGCAPYYPPEVFAKQFPTPATDIFMLAKTSLVLLGGDPATDRMPETVPPEVRELLGRCLRERPSERPRDAWDLHDEFDRVLEKLVGKPKYRPFSMPEAT